MIVGTLSARKKTVFTLLLVLIFLVFLEICGTLYYYIGIPADKRELLESALGIVASRANNVLRYIPHPYFNYVGNPDYRFEDGSRLFNSQGFRWPEWQAKKEGVIRIVALGGSTTYGINYNDGNEVWPALLEKKLQSRWGETIEVINMGLPAYTTAEIIGITAMLVPGLKPDFVLIHVGANDAFAACYPDEGGPDNRQFRFSWNYKPITGFLGFIMRHSRLIRAFGYRYVSAQGYLPGDMVAAMQYPHLSDPEVTINAAAATGKYFQRDIGTLVALVRNCGATPILFTHPLNPQWDYPASVFYQAVTSAHMGNNRIIAAVGKEREVSVVDFYIKMRELRHFIDAIHESPLSMELKADMAASALNSLIEPLKKKNEIP